MFLILNKLCYIVYNIKVSTRIKLVGNNLNLMASIPNYQIQRVIGSGCFGYVFEAYDKKRQKKVALKRIQKVGNQLSRQYQILFSIKNCPNVVQIEDFFYSKNDQNKLIQNIVFQYMDDNLESLIERNIKLKTNLPEINVKKYMYQLFNGLKHIHAKGIAHRDLKPENVLLSKEGVIKICDFGSSKIIDPNGKNTPYIVSRYYRAPELILCITKYSTAIDLWAAGCILAELFLLHPIFKGKTQGDQLFAIFRVMGSLTPQEVLDYQSKVPFDPNLFKQFGSFKKTNLKQMLKMVEDRANLLNLLEKLFEYLPQKRITAVEAMKHPFFKGIEEVEQEQKNKNKND